MQLNQPKTRSNPKRVDIINIPVETAIKMAVLVITPVDMAATNTVAHDWFGHDFL